jgi:hypothetical protein
MKKYLIRFAVFLVYYIVAENPKNKILPTAAVD